MRAVRHFIGGRWIDQDSSPAPIPVTNPADGNTIASVPVADPSVVQRAVRAAAGAFETWRVTPVSRRVGYLFEYSEVVRRHEEELARLISEENGKSLDDSRAELKRTLENIQVACAMPSLMQGDTAVDASTGIDGSVLLLPRGVYGVIAPFNFPAMVPFWFIPYAIAAGDTVIVKPSEQAPLTMLRMAELLDDCGLPAGVLNIVNGDKATAEAVVDDPGISGISFVGSTAAARTVHARCAERGVRVQALGGAKNHLVAMPDARLDHVVRNMVTSCFGCAGQRCMAASVIVCVGKGTHDAVVSRFVDVAKEIVVADPLDDTVPDGSYVMGPVISAAARDRIVGLIGTGVEEGATLALDGRGPVVHGGAKGFFVGPTVLDGVEAGTTVHRTEIFGPVASIITVESLDAAIGVINGLDYGNGASIYTQDGWAARKFKMEAAAGMIGVNVGIPAPVAHLPFGGVNVSNMATIKAQSAESVRFFVETKTVTERYWEAE